MIEFIIREFWRVGKGLLDMAGGKGLLDMGGECSL